MDNFFASTQEQPCDARSAESHYASQEEESHDHLFGQAGSTYFGCSQATDQATSPQYRSPLSAAETTTRSQKTQVSDTAGHNSDGRRYNYSRVSRGESDVVLDSCVPWRRPPVLSSFPIRGQVRHRWIFQVAFFGQPWSTSLHGRAMRGPRSSAARSRRAGRRSRMSDPSSAVPHASLDEYLSSLPAGD